MLNSAFAKSPIIKYILEKINLLLQAAGFEAIDITSKIDKPETFAVGNFATFNTATGNIEDSGKNANDFVPAVSGMGLSEENFTTVYKNIIDNLPEGEIDLSGKMDLVEPTVSNPDTLLAMNSAGQAYSSMVPAAQVAVYGEVTTGALEAGVTETIEHNLDLSNYIINARSADGNNNAICQLLKPNAADPANAIDIKVGVAIDAPGLTLQIVGLKNITIS